MSDKDVSLRCSLGVCSSSSPQIFHVNLSGLSIRRFLCFLTQLGLLCLHPCIFVIHLTFEPLDVEGIRVALPRLRLLATGHVGTFGHAL